MSRYKLRNLDVDRVDLVDIGANQDSHILVSKRHPDTDQYIKDVVVRTKRDQQEGIIWPLVYEPGTGNELYKADNLTAFIAKCNNGLGMELKRRKGKRGTAYPEQQDVHKAVTPGMPAPRKPHPFSGPGMQAPAPVPKPAAPAAPAAPPAALSAAPRPMGAPAAPATAPAPAPRPAGAPSSLGAGPASAPAPGSPPPSSAPRPAQVARFAPDDFDLVSGGSGRMKEWRLRPDRLPEGVEEASITMMAEGETPLFQWMIDPVAGPPVEGTAKSAAEALMALRSAVMTHAFTQTGMLLPMKPGKGVPGWMMRMIENEDGNEKETVGKRLHLAKSRANSLDALLTTIAKSLSEVEVFRPGTSGADLRAILSPDAVDSLSALMERPERHGTTGGV